MLRRNVVRKKSFGIIEAIVENDVLFGGMKEEEVGITAYKTCTDTEVLISLSPIRHSWQICAQSRAGVQARGLADRADCCLGRGFPFSQATPLAFPGLPGYAVLVIHFLLFIWRDTNPQQPQCVYCFLTRLVEKLLRHERSLTGSFRWCLFLSLPRMLCLGKRNEKILFRLM